MESNVNKEDKTSDSKVKFVNDKHARRLIAALNASRNVPHLCDGVVILGQNRINVQKAVLAAASHYFRSVFSYELNGTTKSEVDLTAMEITLETFQILLDYIYTSEIKLCEENIQDILMASDVLLLGDLKEMCCEFLESCITPQNCLGILEFTGRFTCPWVHLKVTQYIDQHFKYIVDTEEFMKLGTEVLIGLLTRLTLHINDDEILNCILSWYKYSEQERNNQVGSVLQACYKDLPAGYKGCQMEGLMPVLRLKVDSIDPPPRGQRDVIIVCGGMDETLVNLHDSCSDIINTVYCIDPLDYVQGSSRSTNHLTRWKALAPMLTRRAGHGLVQCGGCVYALGGRGSDGSMMKSAEKFDPLTNTWTPIASMIEGRAHFRAVSIKDNIYVLGGSIRSMDPLQTMEVYNIFTNTWRMLPEMTITRQGFSCVALNKRIFVMGGVSKADAFDSVEYFDISMETWHNARPLREKRFDGKAAVAANSDIYLFGGMRRIYCPSAMMHGGSVKHCGSEVYSSQTETWNPMLQDTAHDRRLCASQEKTQVYSVVAIGDIIYVIGKIDHGTQFQSTIRGYDIRTQAWFSAVSIFADQRYPLVACAVKIPNFVFFGR